MATEAKNFEALGAGLTILIRRGESFTYAVAGTFVGTVLLQRSSDGGATWVTIRTATAADSGTEVLDYLKTETTLIRYYCSAFTSGTIETSIADVSGDVITQSFKDGAGVDRVYAVDGGAKVAGTLQVTGAVTHDSTVLNTGAVTNSSTLAQTGAATFSAAVNEALGSSIASAASINLTTATGNTVIVTGVVGISTITLAAGYRRTVRFADVVVLTHGSSLIIHTGANITTAAGDIAVFVGDATGAARMISFTRAASLPATISGTETLTNKTLTAPVIATIVSGAGTSTLPTSTDTLVGRATTDTLTNKTLTAPTITDPVISRTGQKRIYTTGAYVGTTAGWLVNNLQLTNLGTAALLPAAATASTLIFRLDGLRVGDTITAYHLVGQIESAGGVCTLDADMRKLTTAAADVTDASIGSITQISVTAQTAISSANSSKTLVTPEVIAADETIYVILTGTTAALTDIALQGIAVTVTEA